MVDCVAVQHYQLEGLRQLKDPLDLVLEENKSLDFFIVKKISTDLYVDQI